jgi:hypothetical protein
MLWNRSGPSLNLNFPSLNIGSAADGSKTQSTYEHLKKNSDSYRAQMQNLPLPQDFREAQDTPSYSELCQNFFLLKATVFGCLKIVTMFSSMLVENSLSAGENMPVTRSTSVCGAIWYHKHFSCFPNCCF